MRGVGTVVLEGHDVCRRESAPTASAEHISWRPVGHLPPAAPPTAACTVRVETSSALLLRSLSAALLLLLAALLLLGLVCGDDIVQRHIHHRSLFALVGRQERRHPAANRDTPSRRASYTKNIVSDAQVEEQG